MFAAIKREGGGGVLHACLIMNSESEAKAILYSHKSKEVYHLYHSTETHAWPEIFNRGTAQSNILLLSVRLSDFKSWCSDFLYKSSNWLYHLEGKCEPTLNNSTLLQNVYHSNIARIESQRDYIEWVYKRSS